MSKLLSRFGSKRDLNDRQDFQCIVRLLDDEEVVQTTFHADQKGQYLLDYVFKSLNLLEKDYFGLRYVDANELRVSVSQLFGFWFVVLTLCECP